ncbi:hypothetical protein KSF73_07830 [Burkholderiaceae bacterium DAT-1]|nr:hypothetical protein [Burkholderiaceae bacterium DAT-1]
MELHELLEQVEDADSFMHFVRVLYCDFQTNPQTWENKTLDQFFDGSIAWAEATHVGASQGLADASVWKRMATFLYCGKIYE